MATQTPPKLLTAEDVLASDLGDGTFELVRGAVVELPPPSPEHGVICGNLAILLGVYGMQAGDGYLLTNNSSVLTERDPDTVRGPDIWFYSHARWPREQVGQDLPPVAPDVVVEVYSPSNQPSKMRLKVNEFLNAGVPLVWVVQPVRKQLAIDRPEEPLPIVPELPGFRCAVADIFA